jgi:hypothetical protein
MMPAVLKEAIFSIKLERVKAAEQFSNHVPEIVQIETDRCETSTLE